MNELPFALGSAAVVLFGIGCGGIAIIDDGGAGGAGTTSTQNAVQTTNAATKSAATKAATAAPSVTTGFSDGCALPVGSSCNPATFPTCDTVPVDGIPCCHIAKICGQAGVAWEGAFCTDNCAQNCELVLNPEHCEAMPWCALGPAGNCVSAPPPP